jgi:hypothetical protein
MRDLPTAPAGLAPARDVRLNDLMPLLPEGVCWRLIFGAAHSKALPPVSARLARYCGG